jgi:hypothetical protein
MRHPVSLAFLLASLMSCAAVGAECAYPKAPESIPDGKTASVDEMNAATHAFRIYNDEVAAFGDCLDDESSTHVAGTDESLAIRSQQLRKYSLVVGELREKVAQLDEQMRAFKARW